MDIKNTIIEKANNWKNAVIKYNMAVNNTAKLYCDYNEDTAAEIRKTVNDRLILIEKKDKKVSKTHRELLSELIKIQNYNMRKQLIELLTTTADFAGLDEKSIKYLQSPEMTQEMLDTCVHLHDISIEHQLMVADKLVEFVQTQKEIAGED